MPETYVGLRGAQAPLTPRSPRRRKRRAAPCHADDPPVDLEARMFYANTQAFHRRPAVLAECPDHNCRRTGFCQAEIERGGGRHCKRYYWTAPEWRMNLAIKIEKWLEENGSKASAEPEMATEDDAWVPVARRAFDVRKPSIDRGRLRQAHLDYYNAQVFTPFAKGR